MEAALLLLLKFLRDAAGVTEEDGVSIIKLEVLTPEFEGATTVKSWLDFLLGPSVSRSNSLINGRMAGGFAIEAESPVELLAALGFGEKELAEFDVDVLFIKAKGDCVDDMN